MFGAEFVAFDPVAVNEFARDWINVGCWFNPIFGEAVTAIGWFCTGKIIC